MLTGTNPPYHDVHDNLGYQLAPANLTLAEVLHGNGFVTGAIVSSAVLDSQMGLNQGFDEYYDEMGDNTVWDAENERLGGPTTQLAIQWLDRHQADRGFLFLHYYDPHEPYVSPEPFASRFSEQPYAGEVAYVDDCIGQVIGKLKELGLYDSTLLIITGDHGEMLGEHFETYHGYFIYQSAIRVPLIIRVPDQHVGRRVSDLVGLVDIAPTVCSLLEVDRPPVVHGEDLSPHLLSGTVSSPPRGIYCESFAPTMFDANPLLGLVTEQWKFIQTTRPELYELPADPGETKNLADHDLGQVESLQRQLQQTLLEQSRQLAESNLQLDEPTRRRLESLGYVGGGTKTKASRVDYAQDPNLDDPKDLIGFYNDYLWLSLFQRKGNFAEARETCQQMIAQRPQSWLPYSHLADMAMTEGDYAEAEANLNEILARKNSMHAAAHVRLGLAMQPQGKSNEARAHFQQATELQPDYADGHLHLGNSLRATGNLEGAMEAYRRALAADPKLVQAHLRLVEALQQQGRIEEAVRQCRQAVLADPRSREVHYHLAMMLLETDQVDEGLSELREAMRLSPRWPLALGTLAWVLATSPEERVRDAREATELAEQAAVLTNRRDPLILDVLAASYAASGRFEEAVTTVRAAIDLATAVGGQRLVDNCRRRMQLYQQGQPYREPAPKRGATTTR
jgi:arylsulfatase A-like enzyme/Tfp pilus assembly protein PilF